MIRTESIELIEELFMPCAFCVVKEQYKDIDDVEALPFVWKLLLSACEIYDKAIEKGKTEPQATNEVFNLFLSKSCKS